MHKVNLPTRLQELAEMWALGNASLTDVAKAVEEYPLHEQALLMSRAMIHAELYSKEYEEWMAHMNENGGADLI